MHPRLRIPLFVLAALLSLGICSGSAWATGRIVLERWTFEEEEEPAGDLFLFEEGSEEFKPLPVSGLYPSLDPSGKLIAYYSFFPAPGIYVTDIEGRHSQRLVAMSEFGSRSEQEWAPDGQSILASYEEDIAIFHPWDESGEGTPVISWPGKQRSATWSGDGKHIAFFSNTDPAGEEFGSVNTYAMFVANADGSAPVQVGEPEVLTDLFGSEYILDFQHLTLSPDGTDLAVAAYIEGPEEEWEDEEVLRVDVSSGAITELTHSKGEVSWPDWLPNGDIAYIHHSDPGEYWKQTQLMKISSEGGVSEQLGPATEEEGQKWIASLSGLQPSELPELTSESSDRAEELLYKYSPTLRYDSRELYRALGVSSITDVYSGTEPEDSNRLVDEAGEAIAYSNPLLSEPPLELGFLQGDEATYSETETPVSEGDRLVERESYESDAAALQSDPYVKDRIYGRTVYEGGHWWLQYWLWSYYDLFNLFGFGDHEGDWEMIMVQLGKNGQPVDGVYAQHHDSEADRCKFSYLSWTVGFYGNVSPNIFVARGSHASYVRPGLLLGSPPLDETDNNGYVARPLLVPLPGEGWGVWPGRWGNSLGEGTSPMAPISQSLRWDEPQEFLEQAESCPHEEEGEILSRASKQRELAPKMAVRPLPPRIRKAKITGGGVEVEYDMRRRPGENRPLGIAVFVASSRKSVTPTHASVWRKNGGELKVNLPAGPGPFWITVQTGTEGSVTSRRLIRRLRGNASRDQTVVIAGSRRASTPRSQMRRYFHRAGGSRRADQRVVEASLRKAAHR